MPELELSEPKIVPKSEVDKKAEDARKKRELPKKPGDNVSFKELCEWLKLLSPDMIDGYRIQLYFYRTDPPIVRQFVDPTSDNNIDVIQDGFDQLTEDYVIERHGGGGYKIVVKDLDRPNEKGGFFNARLNIPMSLHEPKLDFREVDWTHKNSKGYRAYCRAKGYIDENNMPVEVIKKETKEASDSKAMVDAMKLAMDFASKMSQKDQEELKRRIAGEDSLGKNISEIFIEKMKQEDPNKQLAMFAQLLAAMKGMQPEIKPDNTLATVVVPMITMMQESSQRMFTMMMELFKSQQANSNTGESRDSISQLKDLLEVAKELKGGTRTPERSITEQLIDAGATLLPKVFDTVNGVIALRQQAMNPNQPIQPKVQPMNNQPNNSSPTSQPTIQAPEASMIIQQFGPLIEKHLGNPGYEFAALVEEMFGPETIALAVKNGPNELLEGAKSVPQFWQKVSAIYGEQHISKWLTEFCNYKEELAKMEEEDEERVEKAE